MTESTPPSDAAFNDSLSFIKKLWGGMGVPGMGASGMTMPAMPGMSIPTLSVEELDKQIQDLKSVETWLNMNVTMLHNTIQALEIQRATIATLHSLSSTMAQTMQGSVSDSETHAGKKGETPKSVDEKKYADAFAKLSPELSPFVAQSAAWWNGVQEQFKQALGAALANSAVKTEAGKSVTPTKKASTTTTDASVASAKPETKPTKKVATRPKSTSTSKARKAD